MISDIILNTSSSSSSSSSSSIVEVVAAIAIDVDDVRRTRLVPPPLRVCQQLLCMLSPLLLAFLPTASTLALPVVADVAVGATAITEAGGGGITAPVVDVVVVVDATTTARGLRTFIKSIPYRRFMLSLVIVFFFILFNFFQHILFEILNILST